jgi:pyrroline-5-carboxylate reductase
MIRRLAIVGCGAMGESLLAGLVSAGWDPENLIVAECSHDRQAAIRKSYGVEVVSSAAQAAMGVSALILAVKAADAPPALTGINWMAGAPRLLISLCAGVPATALEQIAPGAAVVRAMSTIAVRVGRGTTTIAGGASAWESDVAEAASLFSKVGGVRQIPEGAFDGVTALSGSGAAYVFLLAESLIEAGVSCGLPRALSASLTRQTLLGAVQMMAESDDSPAVLRQAVTSPAGTTAAAVRVLERYRFRSAVLDAVHASAARSREMTDQIASTWTQGT